MLSIVMCQIKIIFTRQGLLNLLRSFVKIVTAYSRQLFLPAQHFINYENDSHVIGCNLLIPKARITQVVFDYNH